jgi:predicted PurR-regulated permease PerM
VPYLQLVAQELPLDSTFSLKLIKTRSCSEFFLLYSLSNHSKMNAKIISNGILRALATLIFCGLLLFFVYKIQSVIIYVILSIILTLITNPVVEFLRRKLKFSNTLAVAFTITIVMILMFGLIMLFVPLIISQGKNLSLLDTKSIENNTLIVINNIQQFLINHNIDAANMLKEANITSKLDFNFIPSFLNSILGTLSNFGMGLASVLFITFFFLKDKVLFITGVKKVLPDDHEEKILNSLTKINTLLSRYFVGLIIQLSIVFILYLIVLLIFGIENAFVIAFLCAILNIVPYVGPLIGSILAGILTLLSNLGSDFQTAALPTTLYVLIGFWIVQLIDNNLSQPIIFSKSVNSHPLEIFLVTLVSGFSFGIIGMIVAVPFYTMLKVIAKEFFPDNKIIKTIAKNI